MNEDERVNHPKYYEVKAEDDRDHPECIDLLELITFGLPGVLALDLGQLKYLYRLGHKPEQGLTKREKAIEDANKILWYAKDLQRHWSFYTKNFDAVNYYIGEHTMARLVAEEFAMNKPDAIKDCVRRVIHCAYELSTTNSNVEQYVESVQHLVDACKSTRDEDW